MQCRYFGWHLRVILKVSANWDDLVFLCYGSNNRFLPFTSKGYVYLVFESEKSVRALLQACSQNLLSPDGLSEYYFKMSSRRMRCKEVSRAQRALQLTAGGAGEILGGEGAHRVTQLQDLSRAAEVKLALGHL